MGGGYQGDGLSTAGEGSINLNGKDDGVALAAGRRDRHNRVWQLDGGGEGGMGAMSEAMSAPSATAPTIEPPVIGDSEAMGGPSLDSH